MKLVITTIQCFQDLNYLIYPEGEYRLFFRHYQSDPMNNFEISLHINNTNTSHKIASFNTLPFKIDLKKLEKLIKVKQNELFLQEIKQPLLKHKDMLITNYICHIAECNQKVGYLTGLDSICLRGYHYAYCKTHYLAYHKIKDVPKDDYDTKELTYKTKCYSCGDKERALYITQDDCCDNYIPSCKRCAYFYFRERNLKPIEKRGK